MTLEQRALSGTTLAAGIEGRELNDGATPLMLIAGLGGRAAFWGNQVAALKDKRSIVLHDHRGTGASARDPGPYSIAQMSADALAVLDHFNIETTDIVGHSTGGAVAQYLSIHHRERVRKVVISASWAGPNTFLESLFDIRSRILRELGPEAYLTDGQLRGFPAQIMMEKAATIGSDRAARLAQFPGEEIEQARMKAVLGHDVRADLGLIRAETMVICAADDQITPLPLSEELAGAIPGAALTTLPTGGHFAPQAVPELYTPAITAFLEG